MFLKLYINNKTSKPRVPSATRRVIPVISTPYFTKSRKDKVKSLLFNIPSHIIPARAPIGVMFAPRLEPITTAKATKN